ncbi:hypothetical protein J6590_034809 [Homalodisca vitripennis]|nr:hypothetical protein J6590_034809 [Homalodisca vitripennis]
MEDKGVADRSDEAQRQMLCKREIKAIYNVSSDETVRKFIGEKRIEPPDLGVGLLSTVVLPNVPTLYLAFFLRFMTLPPPPAVPPFSPLQMSLSRGKITFVRFDSSMSVGSNPDTLNERGPIYFRDVPLRLLCCRHSSSSEDGGVQLHTQFKADRRLKKTEVLPAFAIESQPPCCVSTSLTLKRSLNKKLNTTLIIKTELQNAGHNRSAFADPPPTTDKLQTKKRRCPLLMHTSYHTSPFGEFTQLKCGEKQLKCCIRSGQGKKPDRRLLITVTRNNNKGPRAKNHILVHVQKCNGGDGDDHFDFAIATFPKYSGSPPSVRFTRAQGHIDTLLVDGLMNESFTVNENRTVGNSNKCGVQDKTDLTCKDKPRLISVEQLKQSNCPETEEISERMLGAKTAEVRGRRSSAYSTPGKLITNRCFPNRSEVAHAPWVLHTGERGEKIAVPLPHCIAAPAPDTDHRGHGRPLWPTCRRECGYSHLAQVHLEKENVFSCQTDWNTTECSGVCSARPRLGHGARYTTVSAILGNYYRRGGRCGE